MSIFDFLGVSIAIAGAILGILIGALTGTTIISILLFATSGLVLGWLIGVGLGYLIIRYQRPPDSKNVEKTP